MRIASWNVNGIRACWDKGLADYLRETAPDILGVQEVKARPGGLPPEITSPPGYRTLWHGAARPGYSGVGLFVSEAWASRGLWHVAGMGLPEVDCEGRVITLELPDFFYVNVYFPNSGLGGRRMAYKLEFCLRMETFLANLRRRGKPVLLAGDLNIAPYPIDVHDTEKAGGEAGYLPPERAWLRRFLEGPWVDVFRRDHPGESGHYTWWTFFDDDRAANRGWRIDTFVASDELAPRVRCEIHAGVMGSDHCPVAATLF